jgi:hypothetical protein
MTTQILLPPLPVEVYSRLICDIFSNVWNSCSDSDEAAKVLGFSPDTVARWVEHYRAAGIKLKDLPPKEGRMAYVVQQVMRYVGKPRSRGEQNRRTQRRRR